MGYGTQWFWNAWLLLLVTLVKLSIKYCHLESSIYTCLNILVSHWGHATRGVESLPFLAGLFSLLPFFFPKCSFFSPSSSVFCSYTLSSMCHKMKQANCTCYCATPSLQCWAVDLDNFPPPQFFDITAQKCVRFFYWQFWSLTERAGVRTRAAWCSLWIWGIV